MLTAERKRAIEAEAIGEVTRDLISMVFATKRNELGDDWPKVDHVYLGPAPNGVLVLHVGDSMFHFSGRDRIIEHEADRVRVFDAGRVVAEYDVVERDVE